MRVVVITPPEPILEPADARVQLRLDGAADDAFLTLAISAATASIDGPTGWLGRAIGRQTLEARLNDFTGEDCPGDGITLPFPPIHEISSVKYTDSNGAEQTVAGANYRLEGRQLIAAYGVSWPTARNEAGAVRVQFLAGYDPVPDPIKQAVLIMVGDLYRFRDSVAVGTIATSVPHSATVENLLAPFRVFG
jgi:uncharacterized phiE125 gp8 family phage protein